MMKNKSRLAVLILSLLTTPLIMALFIGCNPVALGDQIAVNSAGEAKTAGEEKAQEVLIEPDKNIMDSQLVADIKENLVGYVNGKIKHVHVAEVAMKDSVQDTMHYDVLVMGDGPRTPDQIVTGVYYVLGADKKVIGDSTKFVGSLIHKDGVPYLNTHSKIKNDKNSDPMKLEVVDNGVTLKRESESAFVKSTDAEIISVLMPSVKSMMEQVDGDLRVDDTEYNKFAGTFQTETVAGNAVTMTKLKIKILSPQRAEITMEHFSNEKHDRTTKLDGTRVLDSGRTKIVARDNSGTKYTFELAGESIRCTIESQHSPTTVSLYTRQK